MTALVAGGLLLAGCGGDDDKQEPPATPAAAASFNVSSVLAGSVPANAAAFAEIKLEPGGDAQAAIDELRGLVGDDGDDESLAVELGLDGKKGPDFEKGVKPYIGDRVGGFALVDPNATTSKAKSDEGDGAIVVQVKDQAKLTASLESSFKTSTKKTTVAGQPAYSNADGATMWVGEKLAAIGTEKAVAATIEAQDGETLAKNDRFVNALKQLRADDPMAIGWADVQQAGALSKALSAMDKDGNDALKQLKQSGGAEADALDSLVNAPVPEIDATVAMALLPKPGELKLELGGTQPKPTSGSAQEFAKDGVDAVAALPSGSWLAFGGSMQWTAGMAGVSLDDQLKQLEQLTDEKLPKALTSSLEKIKSVALGLKGDSLMALGGAAIVRTTDADAANELLSTIERELKKESTVTAEKTAIPGADNGLVVSTPDVPLKVAVGVKDDRLVLGIGVESVTNALEGKNALSADPVYKQAQEALGGDAPTLLVNPAPLGLLLGDLPMDDAEAKQAVGALKGIKLVAASNVPSSDTAWRGAFVLRYDAQQLAQATGNGGSGATGGTDSPTITDGQSGR